MDDNQRKIMPGCEKLTKPEEISALKDYLRQGIQENENSLVIGDDNPVMATPVDPIFRKLGDLSERKIVLLNGEKSTVNINSDKVLLDIPGNVSPGEYLETLEVKNNESQIKDRISREDLSKIPGYKEKNLDLEDDHLIKLNKEKVEITRDYVDLPVDRKVRLEDKLVTLDAEKIKDLPDKIVGLDRGDNPTPTPYREPLSDSREISSLSNFLFELDKGESHLPEEYIEPLLKGEDQKPERYIDELLLPKDPDLNQKKVGLEIPVETLPYEKKLDLEDHREIKISEKKLEISENQTLPSSDLVYLDGIGDPKLPEELHTIEEKEVTLDQQKDRLVVPEDPEIDYKKELLPESAFSPSQGISWPGDNMLTGGDRSIQSLDTKEVLLPDDFNEIRNVQNVGYNNGWIGDNMSNDSFSVKEESIRTGFTPGAILPDSYDEVKNVQNKGYNEGWLGDNSNDEKSPRIITGEDLKAHSEPKWDPLIQKPARLAGIDLTSEKGRVEEMDYLNLGEADYETYKKIKAEAESLLGTASGNWAKRVLAYLTAILSRTEKYRLTVDDKDKDVILNLLKTPAVINEANKISSLNVDPPSDPKKVGRPMHENATQVNINNIQTAEGVFGKIKGIANSDFNATQILNDSARWLAEEKILRGDLIKDSSIKQDLLDSVLYSIQAAKNALRAKLGTAPWRLPGAPLDAKSAIGQALFESGSLLEKGKKLADKLLDQGTQDAPLNRPEFDKESGKISQTVWSNGAGSDRSFSEYTGIYKSGEPKNLQYEPSKHLGFKTTLEELCPGGVESGSVKVNSLEDLKDLLEKSPYITTASKVNKNRVMTLDSNHIWELRLFPFLGEINGNCSWLPNIAEINSMNYTFHGVKTDWGEWIPVNSFELQSRKMTQKTVGLYDGEISFPVSMEFTNELRITLVDDQYKSWKRYFELCAECSTYLTKMVNYAENQVHVLNGKGEIAFTSDGKKSYTHLTSNDLMSYADTTPVVKGTICPGMYKNLAFRCLIYVMSPEMSTIQKFDLLVVLKDYNIEYTGEPDASSPDLTLSFSIVGENPDEVEGTHVVKTKTTPTTEEKSESGKKKKGKQIAQNIISASINLLR
jgi:hypothetical protein